MAILPIRVYPDPVLRVRCAQVEAFNDSLRRLVDDMIETMIAAPGVGLAAPQVGVEKSVAVVDTTVGEDAARLKILVNPEIVSRSGSEVDSEGCLSIPGLTEKVKRPLEILVRTQTLEGEAVEFQAEGFEARAMCHEIDHLNGILFIDHLRGLRRDRVRRQLKKLGRDRGKKG